MMPELYIHPSSILSENVKIGKGVFIGPNCIIGFSNYNADNKKLLIKETLLNEVTIGDNCKIMGNAVICQGVTLGGSNRIDYHSYIGENVTTGKNVDIKYGSRVYENVMIGNYCSISSFIAKNCIIGNNCIVQGNIIHSFKDVVYGEDELAPVIEDFAFVGMNSVVIGNVKIAKYSYIGAAAVINKDTLPYKLYIGNPAKEVGDAPRPYKKRPFE